MNAKITRRLRAAKRRIERRLDKSQLGDCSQPVLAGRDIHYELAERAHGLAYGGLGAIVLLARQLGLAEAIDRRLNLLKLHLPYHESDHVLNLAYNALCDGACLDDIELRRNDEVFLDALGAGFRRVLLRGDTDFTQTKHLDRWDDDPRVRFIFGFDCHATLRRLADDLPETAWNPLKRSPKYRVKTRPRARPPRVKQRIVDERGYRDIRLESEEVAEFDYRPVACQKTYRLIVVRKNLTVRDEQGVLFPDYRYFFHLTNDRELTRARAAAIVLRIDGNLVGT